LVVVELCFNYEIRIECWWLGGDAVIFEESIVFIMKSGWRCLIFLWTSKIIELFTDLLTSGKFPNNSYEAEGIFGHPQCQWL
jgi:hypothetical protein